MAGENTDVAFSKLVSKTLYLDGVNSSNLKWSRSFAYLIEYINRELHDVYFLNSGSFVEASQVSGSDVDHMQIFPKVRAFSASTQALDKEDNVLVIDTEHSRYGFSKLKLAKLQQEDSPIKHLIEDCLVKTEDGSLYFSSDKFISFNLKLMGGTDKYSSFGQSKPSIYRHGPCTSIEYDEKDTYLTKSLESDIAIGIECTNWPKEAASWSSRLTAAGWLRREAIDRLQKLPCFLLPVGDPTSDEYALEWRFAFVPTERELIWEFNDTQIHCYVLLKLLKKEFLDPIAPDQLSSFHLKTLVFWESEKGGLVRWQPGNLLQCLHLCLQRLLNSIKSLELPHYIFEKRNLLYSKFNDQTMKKRVIEMIGELQNKIMPCILQSAARKGPLNTLNSIWKSCDHSVADLIQIGSTEIPDDPNILKMFDRGLKCFKGNEAAFTIVHLPTTVRRLVDVAEYLKINSDKWEESLTRKTSCFIAIHLGYRCLAEAETTTDEAKRLQLQEVASHLFIEGRFLDNAAGQLHMATYFYKRGEQYKAMELISILDSKKEDLFFVGKSGRTLGKNYNAVAELDETNVAYDVVFTSEDVTCVPDAVKFECVLLGDKNNWNFCLFHPLVYAYCLLFQICFDRNNAKGCNVCIEKLANVLKIISESIERHRALNLLGFCLRKMGLFHEALDCFRKSVRLVPSVGNAATYHISILFVESMQKQNDGKKDSL